MKPVYITPRVLAHFYLQNEGRVNEDAEILLVLPDGTPTTIRWVDVDKEGRLIFQCKPEAT